MSVAPKHRGQLCNRGSDCTIATTTTITTTPRAELPIFAWTERKVALLCLGYIRQYLRVGAYDLHQVVLIYAVNMFVNHHIGQEKYSTLTYLSDNSVICNFRSAETSDDTLDGTNHQYSTLLFTPYISSLLSKTHQVTMKVHLDKAECKRGFGFKCGILRIAKTQLQRAHDTFKPLDDLSTLFNTEDSHLSLYGINGPWNVDNEALRDLSAHYFHIGRGMRYFGNENGYVETSLRCLGPIQKKRSGVEIDVCVEKDANHAHYVSYKCQGKVLAMRSKPKKSKFHLNFEKFNYLFAFSSLQCGCPEDDRGIMQYHVSFI